MRNPKTINRLRQRTAFERALRADPTSSHSGRAIPDHLGGVSGFSLTCAKSSAGHELGRKMTSKNKLENRGRSLITGGLKLILRGLRTARGRATLYIGRARAEAFAVVARGHAVVLAESAGEVDRVGPTDADGDVADLVGGLDELCGGPLSATAREIRHRRHAHRQRELASEVGGAEGGKLAQVDHPPRTCDVGLELPDDLGHAGRDDDGGELFRSNALRERAEEREELSDRRRPAGRAVDFAEAGDGFANNRRGGFELDRTAAIARQCELQDLARIEPLGELQLKGFLKPVPAFNVVGLAG